MRLMIAEDSTLLREGLVRLLVEEGHDVLGAYGDADALLAQLPSRRPDVVVLDIRMPPTHTDEGLRAALTVRERWPDVGVLVLSQHIERNYAAKLLASNVERVGYLLKDRVAQVEEFLDALDRVHAGGAAIDPEVVRQLVVRTTHTDPLTRLTPANVPSSKPWPRDTPTRRSRRSCTSPRAPSRRTSTRSSTNWT